MRILFFSNEFPNAWRPRKASFNLAMCQALAEQHDIRVVSPVGWREKLAHRPAPPLASAARPESSGGIRAVYPNFYYMPLVSRGLYHHFMWHSVRRPLLETVARFRPDVLLSYWAHPDGAVATKAARLAGIPSVVMVGGSDVLILGRAGRRRKSIVNSLARADAIVAVSEDLKRNVAAMGIDESRIHVVYRGVDCRRFCPGDKVAARIAVNVRPDARLLLWVGRMEAVKGLDTLLTACKLLKQWHTDFQLVLVGSGSQRDRLHTSSQALGLGEQIKFQAAIAHRDLPDWYRAADLTVLPSYSEGVPNVLLESIACGTPFVASRVGGIPEIADPLLDRLVPPSDPQALARAIQASLANSLPCARRSFQPSSLQQSAARLCELFDGQLAGERYSSQLGVVCHE